MVGGIKSECPGGLRRNLQVRIPMKSAMHSNSKPATDSDFKPARYSDLMSAT
jgi:hypothetical protein